MTLSFFKFALSNNSQFISFSIGYSLTVFVIHQRPDKKSYAAKLQISEKGNKDDQSIPQYHKLSINFHFF